LWSWCWMAVFIYLIFFKAHIRTPFQIRICSNKSIDFKLKSLTTSQCAVSPERSFQRSNLCTPRNTRTSMKKKKKSLLFFINVSSIPFLHYKLQSFQPDGKLQLNENHNACIQFVPSYSRQSVGFSSRKPMKCHSNLIEYEKWTTTTGNNEKLCPEQRFITSLI